jgi:uncharacterized protein (TIGR03437 family)
VQQAGQPEVSSEMLVVRNSPGIFTRDDGPAGQTPLAIAYHVNGTPVTLDAPAAPGEQLTLLATGAGPYDLLSLDGFALPDFMTYKLIDPVSVLLGDQTIAPGFSGGRGGQVGVNSIRFTVSPDAVPGSTLELRLSVNGKVSNTTALPIRP